MTPEAEQLAAVRRERGDRNALRACEVGVTTPSGRAYVNEAAAWYWAATLAEDGDLRPVMTGRGGWLHARERAKWFV